jgi:hypothetical protein
MHLRGSAQQPTRTDHTEPMCAAVPPGDRVAPLIDD